MEASLWMGDMEPYVYKRVISRAFATLGETIKSIEIILNNFTGIPARSWFVEFRHLAIVEKHLHN